MLKVLLFSFAFMIGDKIREIRIQNEMSLEDFALSLDVTKNTVKRWEEGVSSPSVSRVREICVKYQVSPEELLGSMHSPQSEASDSLNMIEYDQIYSIMEYFSMTVLLAMTFMDRKFGIVYLLLDIYWARKAKKDHRFMALLGIALIYKTVQLAWLLLFLTAGGHA